LQEVLRPVNDLADLYPTHMDKEEKSFFYPSLEYLSNEEQNAMLEQLWEFDRKLVHEIYLKAVEKAETCMK
jgi:hypothetical protein